jgi:transketolase
MAGEPDAPPYETGPLCLDAGDFHHRLDFLKAQARAIRRWTVAMSGHAHTGHVGSSLSVVDLLTALYFHTLRVNPVLPSWLERDRFIMSKGHAAAGLYATLAARGFSRADTLWTYLNNDSPLAAHISTKVPGVELATGSLGHGLPVAIGVALAAKRFEVEHRTFVMLSDAECQEGSTWEAALAASQFGLDNLIAVVDQNGMQALGATRDIMNLDPMAAKWQAFGWNIREVDGHDMSAVCGALDHLNQHVGKPGVLIARTTIGKGVSFMEGRLEWHYLPPSDEDVAKAMEELS